MGMFDSFFFAEGVLPDNKVPADHEFQTKSLECALDKFVVSNDGFVTRYDMYGVKDDTNINDSVEVYSHEFLYDNNPDVLDRKYLGCKVQHYKLVILNNKIVHVEKLSERGYSNDQGEEL